MPEKYVIPAEEPVSISKRLLNKRDRTKHEMHTNAELLCPYRSRLTLRHHYEAMVAELAGMTLHKKSEKR